MMPPIPVTDVPVVLSHPLNNLLLSAKPTGAMVPPSGHVPQIDGIDHAPSPMPMTPRLPLIHSGTEKVTIRQRFLGLFQRRIQQ